MVAENYAPSLRRLLAHEGGYSDHPSDPGGSTKFGITLCLPWPKSLRARFFAAV